MGSEGEIKFWNRYSKQFEVEKVYGAKALKAFYETAPGRALRLVLTKPSFSKFYGGFQNTLMSAAKVPGFVQNFDIEEAQFEKGSFKNADFSHSFSSFNEFFIRKFKSGERSFPSEPNELGAIAEARYLGFQKTDLEFEFPVKGIQINLKELLGSDLLCEKFLGGPLLIARLCPVDYHRYHYPDDGRVTQSYPLHGPLDSVSPIALRIRRDILFRNERQVSILKTKNFGELAFIEVGATCVGKIIQSHQGKEFKRAQEKGYFLFGGSTVILLGQKDSFQISSDILEHSEKGREVYIRLGDKIGESYT